MNAVNLMTAPAARRRSAPSLSVSREFAVLVGGLLVVLLATVAFVSAHDRVTSRRAQLAKLTEGTSQWTASAAGFEQARSELASRTKAVGEVRQLVATRYDWSQLLSQIAGVMPAGTQLASLSATSPSSANAEAAAAAATAGAATSATSTSGVQLTACAASQAIVADTMVALRRVTGISQVTLSTSSKSAAASGSSASGGGASTGTCAFPVSFQLNLSFGANAAGTPSVATAETASTGVTQ